MTISKHINHAFREELADEAFKVIGEIKELRVHYLLN